MIKNHKLKCHTKNQTGISILIKMFIFRLFQIFIFFGIGSFSFSQSELDSIAIEFCTCLENYKDSLSDKGQRVIMAASDKNDYENVEKDISDYFFSYTNRSKKDLEMLEHIIDYDYTSCEEGISSKHKDYLRLPEDESGEKEAILELVKKMRNIPKCQFAVTILILAVEL